MRELMANATKNALIAILLIFTGCTSVREGLAPDGGKAYALNCSGIGRSWDKCYAKAAELCRTKGYDVLDRNADDPAVAGANSSGVGVSPVRTDERTMVIACKK